MPLAVVTGANRGIGLEFCRQLKEKNFEVVALCRGASSELQKLGVDIFEGVDVSDPASLSAVSKKLGGKQVDLLVNNAGIAHNERWPELDFEAIEEQIAVNSLGPLKVTQALANNLGKGSNIVMITSRMGSIADNSSGAYYGYRMSKAALNAASKSLALDLKPQGIGVFVFHPGYVKTDMTDHRGDITPEESAKSIISSFEKLSLEDTGTFWHSNGQPLPW